MSTVRFGFGLIASACALPIVGAAAFSNAHDSFWIAVLAVVTGFLALGLYYYGLRRTPPSLAALGELAFPVTAAIVGIYVFDDSLRWTQWLGVAITVGVISFLPIRHRRDREGARPRASSGELRLADSEQPAEDDPAPVVVALELRLVEREVVGRARLDRDARAAGAGRS